MAETQEAHEQRLEKIYALASQRSQVKYKFDYISGVNGAQPGKAEVLGNNYDQLLTITFANKHSVKIPYSNIQGSDVTVEGNEVPDNLKKEYLFYINVHCTIDGQGTTVVFSNRQKPEPFSDHLHEFNYFMQHLDTAVQKNAAFKEKLGIRGYSDAIKDGAIMYLSGIDGNLELYKDKVIIDKCKSVEFRGMGRQEIFIRQISGVDVLPAHIVNGHVRIIMPGQIVSGFQDGSSALHDPYTISFDEKENENVNDIKIKINELLQSPADAPATAKDSVNVVDEIRKYKELLDEGILTQEEFVAKKKQLLGI